MGITLKGLSKITGYSAITISRALNKPNLVKEKTREKILYAVNKYHYSPNNVAKALVYNRTNIIYLYVPYNLDPTNQFVLQVSAGISGYLGEHGYSVLFSKKWYNHEAVDGLILMGLSLEDEQNLKSLALEKPLVLFGHSENVDCIDVDNIKGMEMITEYALAKGYKKLAFLGIDENRKFTQDRFQGFKNALAKNHIKYDEKTAIFTENNANSGLLAGKKLLTNNPEIDCILCSSDDQAAGVMQAANQLNRMVPESLAITGFDGLGKELVITPQLTTIHQPIYEIGIELAKLLLKKIHHPRSGNATVNYYTPILKIGNSTRK
ncbi:MAG: LacI family DNA-binding transcriptional regulator [Bacilli bacterium]|nr:LacI family DNA-binding transcriptional regulator [Bacilli bacterium]